MENRKTIKGDIIIVDGVNIWPHELRTATMLANAGYNVKFVPNNSSAASADAYLNNTLYEFKSPEGHSISCVNNNLQRALRRQCKNVVIDSSRIKNVQDRSVKNFLVAMLKKKHGIGHLILVTRDGKVVDINEHARYN